MEADELSAQDLGLVSPPEHTLDEWLEIDVPDTEAAISVIEQLEAGTARDVRAERAGGRIRIRWR
jgi:hypothetical protein